MEGKSIEKKETDKKSIPTCMAHKYALLFFSSIF